MKIHGKGDGDDNLLLAMCNAQDENQQFKFVGNLIQLAKDTSKCLQAGLRGGIPLHGTYLRVYPCNKSSALQQVTWDAPGALKLIGTNYELFRRI